MSDTNVNLYEGLFLFNPAAIGADVNTATQLLTDILNRAEAEILTLGKWDDRRLSYTINGQKRGLYLLSYFKVRGSQIANIERDVNLSEQLLRCMILRADHIGDVELEEARKAQQTSRDLAAVQAAGETPDTAETVEESRSQSETQQPSGESAENVETAPESGTRESENA